MKVSLLHLRLRRRLYKSMPIEDDREAYIRYSRGKYSGVVCDSFTGLMSDYYDTIANYENAEQRLLSAAVV